MSRFTVRRRGAAVVLLVSGLVLAGCSTAPGEASSESPTAVAGPSTAPPSAGGYGFVWHDPAPGVEIDGPEYTFVRAATESFYRALHAGNVDGGFPGFSEAIDRSPEIRAVIDRIGNPGNDPELAGAYDVRVVDRRKEGSTERVEVCLYRDRLMSQSVDDPDQYRVGHMAGFSVDVGALMFDKTGKAPAPDVSGPRTIPQSGNFFGEWKLRSYDFNSRGQSSEGYMADVERCEAARGDIPQVPDTGQTVPAGSQPPIPPVPGWPGDIS